MQLQAFGGCRDCAPLAQALAEGGIEGVLYEEVNDPRGVGVLALSEDPGFFLGKLRRLLGQGPFAGLVQKPEFAFFGRTYALGYEPNLEDWLLKKPRRTVLDPAWPWALWYPLRRTGSFALLPRQEQSQIIKEHSTIGFNFGEAGLAKDIRLACAGLDKDDNDFVIGLVGRELHPLSALVQEMRRTKQTSTFIQSMGPFFVGKAVWQSLPPKDLEAA